jgi:ankyrin repeat protein
MAALVNGASEEVAALLLKAGANPDPDAESRIAISSSTTPLILASTNGMTAIVKALLKRNVAVDKTDGDGWTALKHASNRGHEEVVALLLKAGASPNIADREGWTPLINAAGKGHLEICKALLKAGADVNATGARGLTPLLQAIGARSDGKALDALKELKRMLSGGDDDGDGDDESSLDLITVLLKAGANPNALRDGASLLSEAIKNEDEELAKLLTRYGAAEAAAQATIVTASEDDSQSEAGNALLAAAVHADTKTINGLVQSGIDVNFVGRQGQTALGVLVFGLHDESRGRLFYRNAHQCIDLLLRHGAKPSLGDPCPFLMAAMGRRLHLVNSMLSDVVDINQSIGEGQTALFLSLLAPEAGQPVDDRCALTLIVAGADSSLKHETGVMPIHLAAGSNYLGALQALLDRRPQDVDAKTNTGITPLMMAATEGHADAVRLLIKLGADLSLKDDDGLTAKEVAIKNGNDDLIPLLG